MGPQAYRPASLLVKIAKKVSSFRGPLHLPPRGYVAYSGANVRHFGVVAQVVVVAQAKRVLN